MNLQCEKNMKNNIFHTKKTTTCRYAKISWNVKLFLLQRFLLYCKKKKNPRSYYYDDKNNDMWVFLQLRALLILQNLEKSTPVNFNFNHQSL